jgi:drug/metabolite transporter (DMT)-like permease
MREPKASLGASLVVASSVFYASYGIWTKLMGNFFDGYTASAFRSLIVLIMLLPIAKYRHEFEKLHLDLNWKPLLGMTAGALVVWGPFYYAVLHAGIGITVTINYAALVIGMFVMGKLLAGEKLNHNKLLSILIGLVGLGLVFSPNLHSIGLVALGAATLSGFGVAVTAVLAKQLPYNATQSTVMLWVTGLVANTLMALVIRAKWPVIGAHLPWLYLVFFAIASVAASWLLITGLKLIDAGAAGILGLLEIVFGVLFGVLFFRERPKLLTLIGVIIITLAAAIPYLKDYHARRGTID